MNSHEFITIIVVKGIRFSYWTDIALNASKA